MFPPVTETIDFYWMLLLIRLKSALSDLIGQTQFLHSHRVKGLEREHVL